MTLSDAVHGATRMAICFVLIALSSCDKADPRIKHSMDALHWSGGNTNAQRVRDALRNAVAKATSASLAKPELVAATAWLPKGKGTLHANWIGTLPAADAMRILLPEGDAFDFPFDATDSAMNQANSTNLLIYQATIFTQRDQPIIWGKIIASHHAKVVLLQKSKIVSNEVPLVFWTPAPPPPVADSGKMIGTVDAAGHTWIYLLSHAVKAGDALTLKDVYPVEFTAGGQGDIRMHQDGYLNSSGPAAFEGRKFSANYPSNETLTTKMFRETAATTRAETK